ncbi:MAG: hypothetical protein MUC87_07670 [Bacteroidia bacterium]|jgi:hypothetical protein|nr:hypothetical protein [Bacteroidia bacterium]
MMHEPVPVPFRYNALKHHVQVQRNWISTYKHDNESVQELLVLGASVMDVYEGKFSPEEIAGEIKTQLLTSSRFTRPEFMAWIGTAGYRELTLSDKSRWVLRPGETYERYIHFHPGRGAAFTFRAKANVLKTAMLWLASAEAGALPDTAGLNGIRLRLDLAPVAEVEDASHLHLLMGKLRG